MSVSYRPDVLYRWKGETVWGFVGSAPKGQLEREADLSRERLQMARDWGKSESAESAGERSPEIEHR